MFGGESAYCRGKVRNFRGRHARIARGRAMYGKNFEYCSGKMTGLLSRGARIPRGSAMLGGDPAYCHGNMANFFPGERGLREVVQCLGSTLHIVVVI